MRFEYADGRVPVAMTREGAFYTLHYDQIGSLQLVVDASGSVVKQVSYDSLGCVLSDSNPAFDMPLGFAGGLYDGDTGLVRFGYRDYDPDVGRWTAKDPLLFAGGDIDLYGYCLEDQINLVDPDGQNPLLAALGLGLLVDIALNIDYDVSPWEICLSISLLPACSRKDFRCLSSLE